MATKKFKKLPKDSQRAAFAQMDEDGTRQNRGSKSGGAVVVKKLGKSESKLPHIKTAEQKFLLEKSNYAYSKGTKDEKERMLQGLTNGEIKAEQALAGAKRKDFIDLKTRKEQKEFLSSARAFRLSLKTGKKK